MRRDISIARDRQTSPVLRSIVLMTESIFPLNTCLARLSPDRQHGGAGWQAPRNDIGQKKDARPDDHSDNDQRGVDQTQPARKLVHYGVVLTISAGGCGQPGCRPSAHTTSLPAIRGSRSEGSP